MENHICSSESGQFSPKPVILPPIDAAKHPVYRPLDMRSEPVFQNEPLPQDQEPLETNADKVAERASESR